MLVSSRRLSVLLTGVTSAAVVASLVSVPQVQAAAGLSGPSRPSAAAAGELAERRTATSSTRRNSDGTLTTTVFAAPVHYRAGGRWEPIDPRLIGAGPAGTSRFRLSAAGSAGGSAAVNGPVVSYPSAFRNAELSYAVVSTGVKELIRLSGPGAAADYTFRLSGPATGAVPTVRRRPDGSHAVFVPSRPDPVFVLDAPTVAEGADRQQVAPPDPAAKPRLDVRQDGRDLVLQLGIDAGWLAAPGRRFPVEIDPTFTVQPDVEDAFFGMPNYGAMTAEGIFIGTTDRAWRGAIQFDLAA